MMMSRLVMVAVFASLAACAPEPLETTAGPDAATSGSGKGDGTESTADAAVAPPDAPTVACPPGLPDSFGTLTNQTTTKNGPGSPAMYDSYNVFARLNGNQRWFFAMNMHVGSFAANMTYDIKGDDTDETKCRHCINLFADLDSTAGGPSLHMFAQSGTIKITTMSADKTSISGALTDVMLQAIEIEYDDQSIACGDDINDSACGNSICLNHHCGRMQLLEGCTTSIKSWAF